MNKLSVLFIIIGLIILAYGGYSFFQMESAQKDTMDKAIALLEAEPFQEVDDGSGKSATSFSPQTGETVGILHIPKLESDLPIVEGTDEDELAKGVGHYAGTAYPEQNDQIVLSGHRDTVFRRMGELLIGDILTIKLSYGEFSYKISETKVVDADDRTIIVPHDKEVLTLTTCYPFSFIGSAPERYIITALPVSQKDE